MQQLLTDLGYTDVEARLYLFLLENSALTATEISRHIQQTRTNTYMLLNKLIEKKLVTADDSGNVRKFMAANPRVLQTQLRARQQQLHMTAKSLEASMPEMVSAFNVAQQRPGVVHLEGYDGLKASFEDQAKSKTDLLLWGSDVANRDLKVWQLMERGGYKRRALGITTRALFHEAAAEWPHLSDFALKGFDVRLWGSVPVAGEVLIYDNRVTFTTYAPEISVTILTNDVMADTFRTIFEQCWAQARTS